MSNIKKAHEAQAKKAVIALIFGTPGIGKTTLACTAPGSLLIDADGGISRMNPVHRPDFIEVKSWEDIISIFKEDLSSYNTLIIDTAGKALDYLTYHVIKEDSKLARKDGALSLQGYGSLKAVFGQFVRQCQMLGKNLVFVAHDKEEKDGDNTVLRPDIIGGSLAIVMREMDIVGYMETRNGKRTICFDPTDRHYGKNTVGIPGKIEIPDFSTKGSFMADIFEKIKDKEAGNAELVEKYNDLLADFQLHLDGIKMKDLEKINEKVESYQHIWGSKVAMRQILSTHMKDNGIIYKDGKFSKTEKDEKTADQPVTAE
jgi:hypothetical protein